MFSNYKNILIGILLLALTLLTGYHRLMMAEKDKVIAEQANQINALTNTIKTYKALSDAQAIKQKAANIKAEQIGKSYQDFIDKSQRAPENVSCEEASNRMLSAALELQKRR